MTTSRNRNALPRSVFAKGKRYYLVSAQGKKRIWTGLSKISEGLPALYTALAAVQAQAAGVGRVPALVSLWEREVMPAHAAKTQADDRRYGAAIAEAFADFTPAEVETPDCSVFLAQFRAKPRTHNAYRAQLRELMRFAEERGLRPAGSNPLQSIRTLRTPPRGRYITDSELRRIKVAALRAPDGHGNDIDTRSGPMLCALIDMAYLTGQAIGDLLTLEWHQMGRDGITFARAKVAHSTGAKVMIGWTDKLRDVERRLRDLRKHRRAFGAAVFVKQDGQPMSYWGVASAWRRALERAGVAACHFHDLKAKALTDKEAREGIREAQKMGQHSTEGQTADYVRHKTPRKTGATR
jgi:integrase